MSDKSQKSKLIDDYEWLTIGFCAALRNKEYFLFLKDVFNAMNKIQLELEPGGRSETYFLDKIFKTKSVGKNWQKIIALYERNYAPIREFPVSYKKREVAPVVPASEKPDGPNGQDGGDSSYGSSEEWSVTTPQGSGGDLEKTTSAAAAQAPEVKAPSIDDDDDNLDDTTPRELLEYRKLRTALRVIYPPPEPLDGDILAFTKFFLSRAVEKVDEDFRRCKEALEVTCMSLAAFRTPKDDEVRQTEGPKKAMDRREDRQRLVRNLFSLASAQFVCSSSELLKNLMVQADRSRRRPFYAGEGANTLDGRLGGFHGTGLVTLLGGTSGFKTGLMSSIVANHCLASYVNNEEPPAIWGYIGEDGVEAYTRRVLTNLMNRDPFMSQLGYGAFSLSEFSQRLAVDEAFRNDAFLLADTLMSNCHWIKAPENPAEKLKFTLVNILEAFDAKMLAGDVKPRFIIMDYLNLLGLPKDAASSNRAQELSTVAHMMDEWAQQKGLTIITAVQASITGAVAARDMRFYMQEDLHECKSIAHHCRMVISLLPFTEYQEDGKPKRWMAVQILKNRDGEKDQIFTSSLNERSNITFADSKHWSEADWSRHKENILRRKAEVMGIETGMGGQGGQRGGGGQGGGGFNRGGGGQRQQGFAGGKQGGGRQGPPQIATTDVIKAPDGGAI